MRRFTILALAVAAFSITPGANAAMIVGGHNATRSYPFMISLQTTPNGNHRCGGALVRSDWVLTAAHCVDGYDPEELQIMIGSQKLSQPADIHELDEIRVHPLYQGNGYDVALLHLATSATQTPTRIADASEADLWAPGDTATAIGWGSNNYLVGSSPDQLQEVELPVVSDADCDLSYGTYGWDPSTEVCAGEKTGGKDTCQGDSGGPLMVPDAGGNFIVFGTVSWGLGCAFPVFYGVYGEAAGPVLKPWLDAQLPPEASVGVNDATQDEGASGGVTFLEFKVIKTGATAKTVRVDYAFVDGTAVEGSDYEGGSGSIHLLRGETEGIIPVVIKGDDLTEGDETFSIELSGATDASIVKGSAVATIRDDDD